MSNDSQRNSAVNSAARTNVHHTTLKDIEQFIPEKLQHLQRGGIRSGMRRNEVQTQQMLDKIPPSHRVGVDGQSAASKVKEYLSDKDASHIIPHSKGGSSSPENLKFESRAVNRARGNHSMSQREQLGLDVQAQLDNLTGALKAGIGAVPKGAVIGAVTTAPLSMIRNGLRVVRGEISAQEAILETAKEVAAGGGVGATTAFTVTTIAAVCPPVAVALAAVSPMLLVAGGAGMIHEFFNILDNHKEQVKAYYDSLTEQELQHLQKIEEELAYEHEENMAFLADARELSETLVNRPRASGIEGAAARYTETLALVKTSDKAQQIQRSSNGFY